MRAVDSFVNANLYISLHVDFVAIKIFSSLKNDLFSSGV